MQKKTEIEKKLINALKDCKIKKGDNLLVHTDLSKLIKIKGGIRENIEFFFSALKTIIGENGTIAVPAFYHEYSRAKKAFDLKKSPVSKELGLFSSYLIKLKNSKRSINPITSIAAIGKNAEYICNGRTGSAYGIDSAFDRLHKLNAKMLFAGVDMKAMTYVHYVESHVGVPHTYNKFFNTPVYSNGKKINLPISTQVRYRDFGTVYDDISNTKRFEKEGIVNKVKFGNGYLRSTTCHEVYNFLKIKLQKNYFYLLKKIPEFKTNKIPLI